MQNAAENSNNLRTYLWKISTVYPQIPNVSPNGAFDIEAEAAVKAFQRVFSLPVTGIVDLVTWEEIINVYEECIRQDKESLYIQLIPGGYALDEGGESLLLYPIQGILHCLSMVFDYIPKVNISGVMDSQTVNCLKKIQKNSNILPNGCLNYETVKVIVCLYHSHVLNSTVSHNTIMNEEDFNFPEPLISAEETVEPQAEYPPDIECASEDIEVPELEIPPFELPNISFPDINDIFERPTLAEIDDEEPKISEAASEPPISESDTIEHYIGENTEPDIVAPKLDGITKWNIPAPLFPKKNGNKNW